MSSASFIVVGPPLRKHTTAALVARFPRRPDRPSTAARDPRVPRDRRRPPRSPCRGRIEVYEGVGHRLRSPAQRACRGRPRSPSARTDERGRPRGRAPLRRSRRRSGTHAAVGRDRRAQCPHAADDPPTRGSRPESRAAATPRKSSRSRTRFRRSTCPPACRRRPTWSSRAALELLERHRCDVTAIALGSGPAHDVASAARVEGAGARSTRLAQAERPRAARGGPRGRADGPRATTPAPSRAGTRSRTSASSRFDAIGFEPPRAPLTELPTSAPAGCRCARPRSAALAPAATAKRSASPRIRATPPGTVTAASLRTGALRCTKPRVRDASGAGLTKARQRRGLESESLTRSVDPRYLRAHACAPGLTKGRGVGRHVPARAKALKRG